MPNPTFVSIDNITPQQQQEVADPLDIVIAYEEFELEWGSPFVPFEEFLNQECWEDD